MNELPPLLDLLPVSHYDWALPQMLTDTCDQETEATRMHRCPDLGIRDRYFRELVRLSSRA
jgi:hypothetical protein